MPKTSREDRVRVAVVDDHPLMREGIVGRLKREATIEVVGEGQCADDAIALAERYLPDVMLVDINMPGNGLVALQRIAECCPAVKTIVITVREDEETVSHALRVGARGYVLKGIAGSDLIATLHAIHRGDVYITPSLAARLLASQRDAAAETDDTTAQLDALTERETEILRLIAKGKLNKEIAQALKLSEKTIKHYVTNILQKLQVRNRVEAALIAQRELSSERR